MRTRGFTVNHPRAVASEYLLSRILYCGVCDAKIIGTTAKSGQFTYYGCQTYRAARLARLDSSTATGWKAWS